MISIISNLIVPQFSNNSKDILIWEMLPNTDKITIKFKINYPYIESQIFVK